MPLQIVRNDITKMKVDAIVNAATVPCWVVAVWMAASIALQDRNCWLNARRWVAVKQVARSSQRDISSHVSM